jgi:hypothetical protein
MVLLQPYKISSCRAQSVHEKLTPPVYSAWRLILRHCSFRTVAVCHGDALRDVRFSGGMRSPDTKQDPYRRKIFRGQRIVFPCSDGKMKARIKKDACYAFVF